MSTGKPEGKNAKHEIPSLKSLERDFGQKFAYPASTGELHQTDTRFRPSKNARRWT